MDPFICAASGNVISYYKLSEVLEVYFLALYPKTLMHLYCKLKKNFKYT